MCSADRCGYEAWATCMAGCSRLLCGRHFFPELAPRASVGELYARSLIDRRTYDGLSFDYSKRRTDARTRLNLPVVETNDQRNNRVARAERSWMKWSATLPSGRPMCVDCLAQHTVRLPGILDVVEQELANEIEDRDRRQQEATSRLRVNVQAFLRSTQAAASIERAGLLKRGWELHGTSTPTYDTMNPNAWLGTDGLVYSGKPTNSKYGRQVAHADERAVQALFERTAFRPPVHES
jgi:hypothetical protein